MSPPGNLHHWRAHLRRDPAAEQRKLLELADNLAKDLGLGYGRDERGTYSATVLRRLKLCKEDIQALQKGLRPAVEEVEELVSRCV